MTQYIALCPLIALIANKLVILIQNIQHGVTLKTMINCIEVNIIDGVGSCGCAF